jgi:hypothetical protein
VVQLLVLAWATTLPKFQKMGLKLVKEGYSHYISYKDKTFQKAIMEFFGISLKETEFLFFPRDYHYDCDDKKFTF